MRILLIRIKYCFVGLIHCGKTSGLCGTLHVVRYPTWGVLKTGGAFELHHGRDVLHEIITFARDSVKSTNLHALSPADFQNIMQDGEYLFLFIFNTRMILGIIYKLLYELEYCVSQWEFRKELLNLVSLGGVYP